MTAMLLAFLSASAGLYGANISNLGMMSGLSNGYVTSITQDPSGYVWVATEDGLNRFDGRRFVTFNKKNSGLGADELNCVAQIPSDPDRLWIATQRNGMYLYTHSTGIISRFEAPGIDHNAITSISPAKNSGMWLTNFHSGVHYYNPSTGEARVYNRNNIPGLPPRFWTAVEADGGILYVGHEKGGFSVIDTLRHKAVNFIHRDDQPSIPGNQVYAICIDSFGNVWLGTDLGAALFNPVTQQFTPFVHNDADPGSIGAGRIRDIRQLDNGQIWFASSQGGVSILDRSSFSNGIANARFRSIPATGMPKGTSSAYIRALFQDSFGNIWIGNYRTGMDVIPHIDPPVSRIDYMIADDNGFRYKPTWSCDYSHDGTIWIGGEDEIACLKNGGIEIIPLPKASSDGKTFVRAVKTDSKGRVWVGTYDRGGMLFDPKSRSFRQIQGLPADVRVFAEDSGGNIWIGGDGGVFLFDTERDRAVRNEPVNNKLYDHVIQTLAFDRKGNLWVGSFGKGIAVFNKNLECLAHLEEATGFPSNAVNALRCDSKGRIWAATRGGLILIPEPDEHPSAYNKLEAIDNLGISHIQAISEDNSHNIWASTNRGLARINASGDDAILYEISETFPLHTFIENAATSDSAGNIYFASGNGLFSVTPGALDMEETPRVHITDFTVFKEGGDRKENEISIPVTSDRIELQYRQNTFRISFNILDHAMTQTTDFAYKMDGIDNVWISAANGTDALYRNLSPGTYRFMVKQRQKGHNWSEPETVLTIIIEPPLWLTWWAMTLYVLLFIAVIAVSFIFYKNRIKLKQQLLTLEENSRNKQVLNEERLRFYTNITHELRTPLTLILGPLEDLVSDPSMPSQFSPKLQMIRDSSTSLLSMINSILEFRKTETQNRQLHVKAGNLTNLIRELGLRFKELNHNPDVEINLEIEDIGNDIYFDSEMITTIVNNLMSNAVKYTDCGTITLSCKTYADNGSRHTDIVVADTGHGISEEGMKHIFERYYQTDGAHQASGTGIGLAIVKNLAELHQASVSVESKLGKGSVFTFRIATDNIYPEAIHGDQPDAGQRKPDAPESSARMKVLVVDDNPEIRAYITQALAPAYDTIEAKNGLEGIKLVQEECPDIVISDIMMPEMDGITLCRMIKDDFQTSHIPVILLTAKDSISDKEEGYAAGANSYLTKPFSAKLLLTRLQNILRIRKTMRERILKMSASTSTPPTTQTSDTQSITSQSTDSLNQEQSLTEADRRFVERMIEIIKNNLPNKELGVSYIANELCMSYSTLYRKVNSLLGMSTNDFIRQVRFARVKEMLEEGSYSFNEIAYQAGFNGHSAFAKAFKKEFGMSASEYIALHRKEKDSSPDDNPPDGIS